MPFTEGVGDFADLTSSHIAESELVTIDAENVLTLYGDPTIRDEAITVINGWKALTEAPAIAIATNNRDAEYVEDLAAQLPGDIPVLSGLEYANKKTSSEMFLAAASLFDVDPVRAIHVDDQWLSFRGAKMAGYAKGLMVRPFGSSQHKGVKLGRVLDYPVRNGSRLAQAVESLLS